MPIATVNPATGETLATYAPMTDNELESALAAASAARGPMRAASIAQRAGWLRAAADQLDRECDSLAATMTLEMGKIRTSAEVEVRKSAACCRFYADRAEEMLAPEPIDAARVGATSAYVTYQPMGVVLAVMPWNFPLWQAMRFAAPALMAGNVGLLKHAANVPQTALYLGSLFERAGFPPGAFQSLLIEASTVERVMRDGRVAAATLTGSEAAGRAVARTAGDVLKKTVLELGGSDPFIVLPSADVERAAEMAVLSRCQNNGQSCIAAKRLIVHRDVLDRFTTTLVERMATLVVGDPMDPGTDVGPLATERARRDVAELVDDAVRLGATALTGGTMPDGPGWFYPPTVLTGIDRGMRLYAEEAFGPVASLYAVDSLDQAIELANDTAFGLGSVVWTKDENEQRQCIEWLEAGSVTVNGMTVSYPDLPFGGTKTSGYGRELSSHGLREFCNLKTVWCG